MAFYNKPVPSTGAQGLNSREDGEDRQKGLQAEENFPWIAS